MSTLRHGAAARWLVLTGLFLTMPAAAGWSPAAARSGGEGVDVAVRSSSGAGPARAVEGPSPELRAIPDEPVDPLARRAERPPELASLMVRPVRAPSELSADLELDECVRELYGDIRRQPVVGDVLALFLTGHRIHRELSLRCRPSLDGLVLTSTRRF